MYLHNLSTFIDIDTDDFNDVEAAYRILERIENYRYYQKRFLRFSWSRPRTKEQQ
jgi:hypothetical protein